MKTSTARQVIIAPIFWLLFLPAIFLQFVGTLIELTGHATDHFGRWLEDLAEEFRNLATRREPDGN